MMPMRIKLLESNFSFSQLFALNPHFKTSQASATRYLTSTSTSKEKKKHNVAYEEAKPFDSIPSPPGKVPYLGNVVQLVSGFVDRSNSTFTKMHRDFYAKYGPIYQLKLPGGNAMTIITKPQDVKTLYGNDGKYPIQVVFRLHDLIRSVALKERFPLLGLFTEHQKEWLEFRQMVQQDLMRPQSAMFYMDDLEKLIDTFFSVIEEKKNGDDDKMLYDLESTAKCFAMDTTCTIFMQKNFNAQRGGATGLKLIDLNATINRAFKTLTYLPSSLVLKASTFKKAVNAESQLLDICEAATQDFLSRLDKNPHLEKAVMGKLVKKNGKDSPVPSLMAVEAIHAGSDAIGGATCFLLWNMAHYPEAQHKLYKEVVKVLGPNGRMTEEKLAKMTYLKGFVNECVRLPAQIGFMGRRAQTDMVLGGYQIPSGKDVLVGWVHASRDPENFPDPDKFLPERWIRDAPEKYKVKDRFAFLPFGHGPRKCVGEKFTKLMLQMLAYRLVQKYHLVSDGEPLEAVYPAFAVPNRNFGIKFLPREG